MNGIDSENRTQDSMELLSEIQKQYTPEAQQIVDLLGQSNGCLITAASGYGKSSFLMPEVQRLLAAVQVPVVHYLDGTDDFLSKYPLLYPKSGPNRVIILMNLYKEWKKIQVEQTRSFLK